ncbi:MAG: hypothetical protein HW421_1526 [Ignavibacteria bacterium]|nr:hypothetical protein [Ignavibacteria bacterium]
MKIIFILILFYSSSAFASLEKSIIIDHKSASQFEKIPTEFLSATINLKHMFRHASVGTTIDGGLNCLQGTKNNCKQYPQYKYDRRAWQCQPRGNSGWFGKVDDFVTQVTAQEENFDIFSFKYCYLDGLDQVAEPCGGYPSKPDKIKKAWDYLKDNMLTVENKYPQKVFVWWTIPLTQIGQYCTDELNKLIRDYCKENKKILFDLADIECHDTTGAIVKNEQGLEKAFKPYCGEQKPDAAACHPNDFGASIISKAFWVMMAQIAGWEPGITYTKEFDEDSNTDIIISPNPVSDYLEIRLNSIAIGTQINEIRIINSLGECMKKQILSVSSIQRLSVSELNTGIYFINIGNQTFKFVKL